MKIWSGIWKIAWLSGQKVWGDKIKIWATKRRRKNEILMRVSISHLGPEGHHLKWFSQHPVLLRNVSRKLEVTMKGLYNIPPLGSNLDRRNPSLSVASIGRFQVLKKRKIMIAKNKRVVIQGWVSTGSRNEYKNIDYFDIIFNEHNRVLMMLLKPVEQKYNMVHGH